MRWGEQTTDEMSVTILQLVPTHEKDRGKLAAFRERVLSQIAAVEGPAREVGIGERVDSAATSAPE
jgi:hypothetical protein